MFNEKIKLFYIMFLKHIGKIFIPSIALYVQYY